MAKGIIGKKLGMTQIFEADGMLRNYVWTLRPT